MYKPKFKIGQKVYRMEGRKIRPFVVNKIIIYSKNNNIEYKYIDKKRVRVWNVFNFAEIKENSIFPNKQSLLQHHKEKILKQKLKQCERQIRKSEYHLNNAKEELEDIKKRELIKKLSGI